MTIMTDYPKKQVTHMLEETGKAARQAAWELAPLSSARKNELLLRIAGMLEAGAGEILRANGLDVAAARSNGLSEALIDRLMLNQQRLEGIIADVRQVVRLTDPVGEIIDGRKLDSGLDLQRRRVPLGVVAAIYESRPNVTVDVAALCLKTGNAVILRGGKETRHSNRALAEIIRQALEDCRLPAAAVQVIDDPDRAIVAELLRLDRYVDMLIPRGGASLHKLCREQSTIPVITGGIGVCHIFVDQSADLDKALVVIENAKVQRPSACNSLETLLVHRAVAAEFLPRVAEHLSKKGVTLHASPEALPLLQLPVESLAESQGEPGAKGNAARILPVQDAEYDDEWLSLDLNVKVVAGLTEAVEHIRAHGSQHSDAILTGAMSNADLFVAQVDSAAVYVNASTRFTDGAQFGLGAEVAVSTQKLHARGPLALEALTTYKWIGYGDNLIRS